MTEGRDRGHRVVVAYFCKHHHKTGAGGMGFGRALLCDWE